VPHDDAITFGDLVDKLDVLVIEAEKSGPVGRYTVKVL
jgi:hypothetical protein